MSTVSETNQLDVGGWAADTLHAWVRSMLDQIDRRNEQRFIEQENALEKALVSAKEAMLANFVERDKAVEILADALKDRIQVGETNLSDHIVQQVSQIREALIATKELHLAQYTSNAAKIETAAQDFTSRFEVRVKGVESQIQGVHREIDIETKANKEAVDKADKANEKRFESVNEFRAQMADQSALFISRREVEAMVGSSADKIAALTDRINRSEGRGTGKDQLWGYIMGGVAALLAFMMYLNSNKQELPAANAGKIDLTQTQVEMLRNEIRQLRDEKTKTP